MHIPRPHSNSKFGIEKIVALLWLHRFFRSVVHIHRQEKKHDSEMLVHHICAPPENINFFC